MNISKFIRPDIVSMTPYTPIVPFEILSEELGIPPEEIVKLDANENPYGPSPKALEAIANGRYYHIYPDPESTILREKLAAYTGVSDNYLLTGMGADELIDLILRVVLSPEDKVLDSPPSFGMYPFSTQVNSGQYLVAPRDADFKINISGIEAAVSQDPNIKIVFACSPNNPDGSVISESDLARLLALPVLIVLDEAYIEFAAVDGKLGHIQLVEKHENLCVLRTFSKLAALAGLRIGYGAFPKWLRSHMLKVKQPYNINYAADLAARASLDDKPYLEEKVQLLVAERKRMATLLAQFDCLIPLPSFSNFVLCQVIGRDAGILKQRLQDEYGVLVRYYDKPGLSNFIRISAGWPEDTDKLVAAIQKIQDNKTR
ncbi:MAG: histidinol-phosphate aminotransferase [Cellvibrionaceae bacterium]|jgi:histidinol-phosphate aminotransferase